MRIIIILSIMLCNIGLYSMEYNTYEMVKVHEFNASEDTKDNSYLRTNFYDQDPHGPMLYFDNDKLVLADQNNNRTIILNENYSFSQIYNFSFFEDKIYNFGKFFIGFNKAYGVVVSDDEKIIIRVSFDDIIQLRQSTNVFYHSNILFIYDKNGKLWSIKNPGLDKNLNILNLLNETETIKLFMNKNIVDGLTIDSKKRIYLDGELQTVDIKIFTEYKKNTRDIENKPYTEKNFEEDYFVDNSGVFIGFDEDGNSYWYYNRGVLVINAYGWPIMIFTVNDQSKVSTTPTVSNKGDVFFLHSEPDLVTLYKIPRKW